VARESAREGEKKISFGADLASRGGGTEARIPGSLSSKGEKEEKSRPLSLFHSPLALKETRYSQATAETVRVDKQRERKEGGPAYPYWFEGDKGGGGGDRRRDH